MIKNSIFIAIALVIFSTSFAYADTDIKDWFLNLSGKVSQTVQGSVTIANKLYTSPTVDADTSATVVTKGYLESKAGNSSNFSPALNDTTWQSVYLPTTASGDQIGIYPCGYAQVVTLTGTGITAASQGALVSFYQNDTYHESVTIKLYDMAGNVQGLLGQSGRDGDGKSFGMGGDTFIKLTNQQFQIRACRNNTYGATIMFKSKGVVN